MNMENCGRCYFRKHIYIKDSDKYVALDILLKFGSLDKMRITDSYPKIYILGDLGKGLITSLGLKAETRPNK